MCQVCSGFLESGDKGEVRKYILGEAEMSDIKDTGYPASEASGGGGATGVSEIRRPELHLAPGARAVARSHRQRPGPAVGGAAQWVAALEGLESYPMLKVKEQW